MIKSIQIILPPAKNTPEHLLKIAAGLCKVKKEEITHLEIAKQSLDARKKTPKLVMTVKVYIGEEPQKASLEPSFKPVLDDKKVHIIGFGPAGLFAAIRALELGVKPIVYERGKEVRDRRRDLAVLNKEHIVNPESNYCYGEGGAGTYSDGKLYTRSKKRGSVKKVLETLVHYGAPAEILSDAHPHIGTNKLPGLIENMRESILAAGGEIHFEHKLTGLTLVDKKLTGFEINGTQVIEAAELVLATGHSARDVFELLHKNKVRLEFKPFALGVRIEHPQSFVDAVRYHCNVSKGRGEFLPPASYNLVHQVRGKGVFTFCMCPGGIIAPCATDVEEVVTNGWSPSKRNNPFANSGVVVEVGEKDLVEYKKYGYFKGLEFQKSVERTCWEAGGKTQKVPAQRLTDFLQKKASTSLPETSYIPGITPVNLWEVLPKFIAQALKEAFLAFDEQMPGYISSDAILHAPESRTSSPIRIPRDKETFEHTNVKGLYPTAEGAGYAGGIVSAAIDGMKVVEAIEAKVGV